MLLALVACAEKEPPPRDTGGLPEFNALRARAKPDAGKIVVARAEPPKPAPVEEAPDAGPSGVLQFPQLKFAGGATPLGAPPWHAPGGAWSFAECQLESGTLVMGNAQATWFDARRSTAIAPAGGFLLAPANEADRAAMVAELAKRFGVPAPTVPAEAKGPTLLSSGYIEGAKHVVMAADAGRDGNPAGQLLATWGPSDQATCALSSGRPTELLELLARGAEPLPPGWNVAGDWGTTSDGFTADGKRLLLRQPRGGKTALVAVDLATQASVTLAQFEDAVLDVQCVGAPLSCAVLTAEGDTGTVWWVVEASKTVKALRKKVAVAHGAWTIPASTFDPRLLPSPLGNVLAMMIPTECLPDGCDGQLEFVDTSSGATLSTLRVEQLGSELGWLPSAPPLFEIVLGESPMGRLIGRQPPARTGQAIDPKTGKKKSTRPIHPYRLNPSPSRARFLFAESGRPTIGAPSGKGGKTIAIPREFERGCCSWSGEDLLLVNFNGWGEYPTLRGAVELSSGKAFDLAVPAGPVDVREFSPGLRWVLGGFGGRLVWAEVKLTPRAK